MRGLPSSTPVPRRMRRWPAKLASHPGVRMVAGARGGDDLGATATLDQRGREAGVRAVGERGEMEARRPEGVAGARAYPLAHLPRRGGGRRWRGEQPTTAALTRREEEDGSRWGWAGPRGPAAR